MNPDQDRDAWARKRDPLDCPGCTGDPADHPAPLVAGAIGRSLTDAREAYRAELVALWHGVVEQLPED
jgi:hypothetical protein